MFDCVRDALDFFTHYYPPISLQISIPKVLYTQHNTIIQNQRAHIICSARHTTPNAAGERREAEKKKKPITIMLLNLAHS